MVDFIERRKYMCGWCNKLETLKERLEQFPAGYPIGKEANYMPWGVNDIIKINLWYDKEHGMKNREFLMELSYSENNNDKAIRLIAPIKYCPNCGKELKV
jgi:hypothetical protein